MKSIRAKIMWLLFSSVVIASLIIGTMSVILTSSIIEKNSTDNMTLLCKTNADEIEILLAKTEDSVDTLAHYAQAELTDIQILKNDLFRNLYSANLEKSALHHIESIDGAVAVWLQYDASYVGKTDGFLCVKNTATDEFIRQPVVDIPSYDNNDAEKFRWWHTAIRKGEATWLDSYYDTSIKQQIISYVVPLYKGEQLIGVLGADISIEHIEKITKEISIYSSGKAAILNSDGTVVYHPNFKQGHLIGEGDPGFEGVVEALSKEEYTNQLIAYELDGVDKKIASCKLRNGMLMVCFAPVSEIYQEQRMILLYTTAIISIVLFGTLLITFFISGQMARPIKKLNEAAKHLTDGEFDFNISSDSHDEIGELTSTFIETRNVLKHQFDLLDAEAHRDGLTGVGNKSAFIDREAKINQTISDGTAAFSIAVFDVNKLKITNDIFGHIAGDRLLATVSGFLRSYFNVQDIYRVGGDEFVVVLTEKDCDTCSDLIKECISNMRTLSVEGVPECRVSCACGLAHFDSNIDHQFSDVLRRADNEMYKNKSLTKKEIFPWQEGIKGIKQLQVEKYCQLLQTLTISTDDYLFLMNIETGVIRFFGGNYSSFDITDGRELSNGISDMLSFVHINDHLLVKNVISSIINYDTESVDINFRMNNNDNIHWVNCRGSVIKDETDSHFVFIGRISQNAVKHLYNPITTLFNKTKLNSDLQNKSISKFSCLMLIDIDNLSEINLKHGSVYGDKLLKTLAEELENRFSMWQIYHAEKDRFVVLLDVNSSKEAKNIFEEIKASLAGKCSISASVVPNDKSIYVSIENIYDYAVQILNNAKRHSIGQIVFFSKDSLLERISAVELLEELEESVKNKFKGFHLVYQPQISADDFSIISAEALLRFESKTSGQVHPDRFIPLLEQTGLINEVGIWVVNEGLQRCKEWRKFIPDFKISVNISPKQLEKKSIAAQITRLLSKHKLPGEALILEITESAQLNQNDDVFAVLAKFRQAGIQIAIDDFGTGYSNLGNLKHIHANILKVDRVFIHGIKGNGYNYTLIHNVIEFAKANSLKVCLEGIENTSELIAISGLQPDILQGYLFDKPCPADVIEAKYFISDTAEYAKRLEEVERLSKEKRHAPLVKMEMKTILQGINVGLWIIRLDTNSGEGELYTDETMRKLLGIDDSITPKECFKHWQKNIHKKYYSDVDKMIDDMANSKNVTQVEYLWHHPQKGILNVRCSGRCVEKNDKIIVFEGFHRIIDNI